MLCVQTNPNLAENKILLLTVLNPLYTITVDTVHRVCRDSGQVCTVYLLAISFNKFNEGFKRKNLFLF